MVRLTLKLLIILLIISGCAYKEKSTANFLEYFYPDITNPKVALVEIIDGKTIEENYSFFKKFFGYGYDAVPILFRPFAVAANDNYIAVSDIVFGILYVFDKNNFRLKTIREFNSTHLKSIVDLDFDGNDLYLVDSDLGKIIKVNIITDKISFFDIPVKKPTSIKVDRKNNVIFISDKERNNILETDFSGNILKEFNYEMNFPIDIDVIPDERTLFVLDSMNFRVLKFDYNGKLLGSFGSIGNSPGYFSKPKGICIDKYKRVYITDTDFDNFQIFNTNGDLLFFIGKNGSHDDEFYMPERIYCYEDEIYIADLFNSRIKKYKSYE
ncbi:MAG: hypothetical protein JG759_379 [Thermoanaerobacter sp.]|nr:hypothetical protein [Thermoanaerobacter sp.]